MVQNERKAFGPCPPKNSRGVLEDGRWDCGLAAVAGAGWIDSLVSREPTHRRASVLPSEIAQLSVVARRQPPPDCEPGRFRCLPSRSQVLPHESGEILRQCPATPVSGEPRGHRIRPVGPCRQSTHQKRTTQATVRQASAAATAGCRCDRRVGDLVRLKTVASRAPWHSRRTI